MTIQKAIIELQKEYARAITLEFVRNPVSYSLYRVWRKADEERKNNA